MGEVFWEPGRSQDQLHKGEPDIIHGARAESARSRTQTTQWLAAVTKFREQISDFRRQLRERTSGGAVGEVIILPEIAQHFDKMRFAAAEEAADPDSLLLLPPEPIEVGLENSLQSAGIFAIADKGLQLEPKRPDLALVMADLGDLRDAVIEQLDGCGTAEVKFAVNHGFSHGLMKLSVEVMGTAM